MSCKQERKRLGMGTLVWAKMKGFSKWPAKIIKPPETMKIAPKKKNYYCVFFFGSNYHALLHPSNVTPYEDNEHWHEDNKKPISSSLLKAIAAIEKYKKDESQETIPDETIVKLLPRIHKLEIKNHEGDSCPKIIPRTTSLASTEVSEITFGPVINVSPVSSADPEYLIQDGTYIDKTSFLYCLLQKKDFFFMCIRPRRFGKSVFVHTIELFFRGREDVFKSTYIYNKMTDYNWTEYPIMMLNFATLQCANSDQFRNSLYAALKHIASGYDIVLCGESVSVCITDLIEKLRKKYQQKVVVLIDDYDSPLVNCPNKFVTDIAAVMNVVFATLKMKNMDIRLCFTTGISTVALSSVFSGFNNALRLSKDPEFAAAFGYTKQELQTYFKNPISEVAKILNKTDDEVYEEITQWFNGYRFTFVPMTVFNPSSINLYFTSRGQDKTFWSLSGGSSFLKNQILNSSYFTEDLAARKLFYKLKTESDCIKYEISEIDLFGEVDINPTNVSSWAKLFFHIGIFTISDCRGPNDNRKYYLQFTNKEVISFYLKTLTDIVISEFKTLDALLPGLSTSILQEDWSGFVRHINSYIAKFPHTIFDFSKSTESVFQLAMFMLFDKLNYDVDMETMTAVGRIDLVAVSMSKPVLLFEFKIENNNRRDPVSQCSEYRQGFLNAGVPVFCIGIQFSRITKSVIKFGVSKFAENGASIYENKTDGIL